MLRSWSVLASGLVLSLAVSAAGPGVKTQFIGGTLPGVPVKSTARLDLTGPDALLFQYAHTQLRIAYDRIHTVEYGQNVSRRYAAAILISPVLLLSKTRKHYVTIGYTDPEGKEQAVVFRIDKGDIRSVLAALEARTGRRIEYQDDDARKAGKG